MKNWKKICSVIGIMLIACTMFVGCGSSTSSKDSGSSSSASSSSKKTKDGVEETTLKIKNGKEYYAWKKDGVTMTTVAAGYLKGMKFQMYKPSGKLFILVVAMKNEQKDAIRISQPMFKIIDKNTKTEYEASTEATMEYSTIETKASKELNVKSPFLEALNPGLTQCYALVYDLPYDSSKELFDNCYVLGTAGMTGGRVKMPISTKEIEQEENKNQNKN